MQSNQDELALAQTVFRQAEVKFQAQLQTALAADQRAVTLAAIFAAASVAALGIATLAFDRPSPLWAMAGGGIGAGASFFAAAWLCIHAARPVGFYLPGSLPRHWWPKDVDRKPLADCFKAEAKHYEDDIMYNKALMEKNAWFAQLGGWFGVCAPLVGIAAGVGLYVAAPYLS